MSVRSTPYLFGALLIAAAAFAVFFELGRMDVVSDNEGQRATPPAEMLRRHDMVMPTVNGKDYLAKPPMQYWLIAGAYQVTGVISPFTARIPTALAYCALVLAVYLYARRTAGENTGRWAALMLAVSPYIIERARTTELDIPLTLATFGSMALLHAACHASSAGRTARYTVFAGLCLGAAILLKGPVPFLFLAAAWVASLIALNPEPPAWLRKALYWSAGGLLLEFVLMPLALLAPAWKPKFPIALVVVSCVWIFYAWTNAGPRRYRALASLAGVLLLGIACALPWALAVLQREGWSNISQLLHAQVTERTYQASRINSGAPVYYFYGLVGMLAPWGFLLPCQASRAWFDRLNAMSRFHLFAGWLSVLLFSLIAGKEFEYVLPATPFLLIGCADQLAGKGYAHCETWVRRAFRAWFVAVPVLLALFAMAFFFAFMKYHEMILLAELALLGGVALAAGVWSVRPDARLSALVIMTLCVMLGRELATHSFRFRGNDSFKAIAEKTGDLLRSGHEVEAVKMTEAYDVFPAFAFYAAVPVPTVTDPEHVKQKLAGPTPYYCVFRQDLIEKANLPKPSDNVRVLMGPYTNKKLILVGNAPLPQ